MQNMYMSRFDKDSATITLIIKEQNGDQIPCTVYKEATVSQLMYMLEIMGVIEDCRSCDILHGSRLLAASKKLSYYELTDNSIVNVTCSTPGALQGQPRPSKFDMRWIWPYNRF